MKVTCKVCQTTKNIKDEKLIPYRGKTISVKCANKECTNRVKFKVPADIGEERVEEVIEKKEEKLKNQVFEPSLSDTIKCPQCDSLVPKDTRFCTSCGFEMKPPKKEKVVIKKVVSYCEKCGNELIVGEKFCPKCGEPVGKESKERTTKETVITPPKNLVNNPVEQTENKTVEKTEKSIKKTVSSPIHSPTEKRRGKKKGSFLKTFFKIILFLVILAVIGLGVLFLIMINEDKTLNDGPWKMEAYRTEVLFSGSKNRNKSKWNKAVRQVNLEYKSYLDSTSISAPKSVTYTTNAVDLFVDKYNPVNKGNLYYFTVPEPEGNGKMNVVLDLKSKDYFEAKAFFISNSEVSVGYIKGRFKEESKNKSSTNQGTFDKRLLGSWVVIDKATGSKDTNSGWTFVKDGTCYQGANYNEKLLRKWKTSNNNRLSITFPEQTITYNYVFEGNKLIFERYRSYYYFIKK